MQLVINHLTRMNPGYICAAGIDLETDAHIRPALSGSRLKVDLLRRNGGPFDIAHVVDLGPVQPSGNPPETEDHSFDPGRLTVIGEMPPEDFWEVLWDVSTRELREIFGDSLHPQRSGCAVDEGQGFASLGCLVPANPPAIFINSWGKVRARINDGVFDVDLSVTDLRFYDQDRWTPRAQVVDDVQRRISRGVDIILSVGLARAFQITGDTARRHWLQVNNIHLKDDPAWQAT